MEFFDVVEKRQSIRAFEDKEVDKETLHRILETVNRAPSAGDLQAYRITIVRDAELKTQIAIAAVEQMFIAQAPVVLVFSADQKASEVRYGDRGHELYCVQDATIAGAYCQLAVTALGLGCVWVSAFDTLEVSRLINAEEYEVPLAIMPIGYPAEKPERTPRKDLKELVREI